MDDILSANETERLDRLHALGVLHAPDDPVLESLVEVACIAARMPVGLIALVDEERAWFKARRGLALESVPGEQAFSRYAVLGSGPFIVADAGKDARFAAHPLVRGRERIRFYAGMPLEIEPGIRIGSLCLLDRKPRTIDADALEILRRLARCVSERLKNVRLLDAIPHERRVQAAGSLRIVDAARAALRDGAFLLHYQPKVELSTRRHAGYEALLRWRQPDGSILSPGAFLAAIEEPETSRLIGSHVLRRAVEQAAAWQRAGVDFGHIAINVSSSQFAVPDGAQGFADEVHAATRAVGLPPGKLQIEVTEGVLLSGAAGAVAQQLVQLRARGYKVAFDDFGTGFASLIHLKELQYDHIKIDGSFVRAMTRSRADLAIVGAIVDLARGLGKEAIAEGIETTAEYEILQRMGCRYGQGYLFGRPESVDRISNGASRLPEAGGARRAVGGR